LPESLKNQQNDTSALPQAKKNSFTTNGKILPRPFRKEGNKDLY
jgi:hypothetical protein